MNLSKGEPGVIGDKCLIAGDLSIGTIFSILGPRSYYCMTTGRTINGGRVCALHIYSKSIGHYKTLICFCQPHRPWIDQHGACSTPFKLLHCFHALRRNGALGPVMIIRVSAVMPSVMSTGYVINVWQEKLPKDKNNQHKTLMTFKFSQLCKTNVYQLSVKDVWPNSSFHS